MLETERISPRYKNLDTWPIQDISHSLWEGQMRAVSCVKQALPSLEEASNHIAKKLDNPLSRLIYVGAGTSGLLAMQDAMELTPTFGWPLDRIVFLMAGGDEARLSPTGIPEDDISLAQADFITNKINKNDIVLTVAASGSTPYTVEIARKSLSNGAYVVAIANNKECELFRTCSIKIFLDSGCEVIAGSTRMNAGTSQKTALGILSSMTMIRSGRVVDGLMTNVTVDNEKLSERATKIIQTVTDVDEERALEALQRAEGKVNNAILIALGKKREEAEELLAQNNNRLREAMSAMKQA